MLFSFFFRLHPFTQSMPVAASTICLLMLSLDRYATVRHPRLGQLNQRRYLPILLAIAAWLVACLVCVPIFVAHGTHRATTPSSLLMRELTTSKQLINSTGRQNSRGGQLVTTSSLQHYYNTRHLHPTAPVGSGGSGGAGSNLQASSHYVCHAEYGSVEWHTTFAIVHALLVFIVPAVGVLINHLGVRQKLCALSLTARAAHGELPLPMPILRRPTHMIIVTGMTNTRQAAAADSSDDDVVDEKAAPGDKRFVTRLKQVPRTPR